MSRHPEHAALLEQDLDGIRADAWRRLVRGAADRRSPLRTPVLATLDAQGRPAARTLVLRAADPARGTLTCHSDDRAGKIDGLARAPWAAWVFWDPRARIQLRARGPITVHRRDAVAEDAWRRTGPRSQAGYAVEPAPGTPTDAPDAHRRDGDGFEHFAVLVCAVAELEWLLLAHGGHRRAQWDRTPSGWQGRWLVP